MPAQIDPKAKQQFTGASRSAKLQLELAQTLAGNRATFE